MSLLTFNTQTPFHNHFTYVKSLTLKKLIKFVNSQMGLTIQSFGSKHLENFARNFSQNEPKVDDIIKLD
jgi:hypothetical protein